MFDRKERKAKVKESFIAEGGDEGSPRAEPTVEELQEAIAAKAKK